MRRRNRTGPPRIVVAGTNGKGSCVAFLESILTAAGLRTGAYTSPHLHRYNERVRIGGRAVSDGALVEAFERVDAARGDTSLTFFEFGTLAAADIIERARVDVAIMEVGLGGRLDAVNAFEPSVSLITAIGVDHRAWLGDDRESVGREKAGIMRAGVCCVLGEREPPESVVGHARAVGAPCRIPGRDYGFERVPDGWRWWGTGGAAIDDLPPPGLAGPHQVDNAAACLAVIDALSPRVEVSDEAARTGIASARIAGRLQWLDTPPRVLVDVAHNPLGAEALAAYLASNRARPMRRAVCGVLGDKDAGAMLRSLAHEIDAWYLASLPGSRGRDARELAGSASPCGAELRVRFGGGRFRGRARAARRARGGGGLRFVRDRATGASPCNFGDLSGNLSDGGTSQATPCRRGRPRVAGGGVRPDTVRHAR